MKKIIVISTSLRRGSNSDMLAEQFVAGAKAAGNDVEQMIRIRMIWPLHRLNSQITSTE